MGQQVSQRAFSDADYEEFRARLRKETAILMQWFDSDSFEKVSDRTLGLELEIWLTNENYLPTPDNEAFLKAVDSKKVVPELSKFNAEINADPQRLEPGCFTQLQADLERTWGQVSQAAESLGLQPLMIGSLPTLRDPMMTIDYLSDRDRYRALNDEIMRIRKQKPVKLSIEGRDQLSVEHNDILLEAAATSLQIHLQVPPAELGSFYNAAVFAAAPLVALSANSPFLFGKELWQETRIAIFEQSVDLPGFNDAQGNRVGRVTMGSDLVRESVAELFLENLAYPAILPMLFDLPAERMRHLRLHNGTIYRWNRPILDFSESGAPSLRIEHRPLSAGPTLTDAVANICLFVGLVEHFHQTQFALPFGLAKQNFYAAAKLGLDAEFVMPDGNTTNLQSALLQQWIPAAHRALEKMGMESAELSRYFDILECRCRSGQTGSAWQKAFIATHGPDFQTLTKNYFERQQSGIPVHAWNM